MNSHCDVKLRQLIRKRDEHNRPPDNFRPAINSAASDTRDHGRHQRLSRESGIELLLADRRGELAGQRHPEINQRYRESRTDRREPIGLAQAPRVVLASGPLHELVDDRRQLGTGNDGRAIGAALAHRQQHVRGGQRSSTDSHARPASPHGRCGTGSVPFGARGQQRVLGGHRYGGAILTGDARLEPVRQKERAQQPPGHYRDAIRRVRGLSQHELEQLRARQRQVLLHDGLPLVEDASHRQQQRQHRLDVLRGELEYQQLTEGLELLGRPLAADLGDDSVALQHVEAEQRRVKVYRGVVLGRQRLVDQLAEYLTVRGGEALEISILSSSISFTTPLPSPNLYPTCERNTTAHRWHSPSNIVRSRTRYQGTA